MKLAARKSETTYGNAARLEIAASRFIPYTSQLNDSTVRTREGYLLKVIKLTGIGFETTDQIDLDQQKTIRSTLIRSLSDSRFALYHHIVRREGQERAESVFDNDWCRSLDRAYQDGLSSKKLYINEHYLTIIRRPVQGAAGMMTALSRTMFTKIDRVLHDQQEEQNRKALDSAVSQILSTFAPYKPVLLTTKETDEGVFSEPLSFLSYLINREVRPMRLPEMSLAEYLPQKRLSFGKECFEIRGSVPGDTRLGALLSVKDYPDQTTTGMIDALLRLPHEFILTQSFACIDRQAALTTMRDTQRKMIAGEDGAASLEAELDIAIDDLASGRSAFGEHHMTVSVTEQNAAALEQALSALNAAFVAQGIVAVREDINLEPGFWAQLPGNFSYIARRSLISNRNFSAFASLHNFPSGRKAGNHWGHAITRFETTSGTPYWFNFHERDVGNFTVIGPTGTGKTVLLTFLHAQAQRLNPQSVYFDKDRGAEIYIRAIGGSYTVVEAGQKTGLNPLQLPDTPENRAFLREWIGLILSLDDKTALTPAALSLVADAVEAIYDIPAKQRRLSRLAELLAGHEVEHSNSLAARMAIWHGSGERAWLFDNAEDTLALSNKTLGFDLTTILDDPRCRTPWLMYVFHRINALLTGEKTIIMLDEGWKLLDDPAFSARIKDWMKTIRKLNGIVGFATQSARDALNSAVGDAIIEQSPTQIFLPNPRAKDEDYCKGFGLSPREVTLIRDLTPQSRCFLIRQGVNSVVARLDLGGMDDFTAILSGRAETVRLMDDLMCQYGDDWLSVFQERRKTL